MDSADSSLSRDPLPSSPAKPQTRAPAQVKPQHRLQAASLRPTMRRASSEPPTAVFEERPTIPMWGLTGMIPAPGPSPSPEHTPPPPPAPELAVASEPAAAAVEAVPTTRLRPTKTEPPTFGAGMLQARKVRVKDPMATQRVRAVADAPMFGASMLRTQQSSAAKWVALALAVAAIAAVVLAAL